MRENIYGPENRIVGANVRKGETYHTLLALDPPDPYRYAAVVHRDYGLPTIKILDVQEHHPYVPEHMWHETTVVTYASYNGKGEEVARYTGVMNFWYTIADGKSVGYYSFTNYWVHPLPVFGEGMPLWSSSTGTGALYEDGRKTSSLTTTTLQPTYAEVLEMDQATGSTGVHQIITGSDLNVLGTLVRETNITNLQHTYTHYQVDYQYWKGGPGLNYFNQDNYHPSGGSYSTIGAGGYEVVATEIPEKYAFSTDMLGWDYPVYIWEWGEYFDVKPATLRLDKGDGTLLDYSSMSSRILMGLRDPNPPYDTRWRFGDMHVEDSGIPSPHIENVNYARYVFSRFPIGISSGMYGSSSVLYDTGASSIISGSYVPNNGANISSTFIEDTPEGEYVIREQAKRLSMQDGGAGIRAWIGRNRADIEALHSRDANWRLSQSYKALPLLASGAFNFPNLYNRRILTLAAKSKHTYREPLGVTTRDVYIPGPSFGTAQRTTTMKYSTYKKNEEGEKEETVHEFSFVGSRLGVIKTHQVMEDWGPRDFDSEVVTYENWYAKEGEGIVHNQTAGSMNVSEYIVEVAGDKATDIRYGAAGTGTGLAVWDGTVNVLEELTEGYQAYYPSGYRLSLAEGISQAIDQQQCTPPYPPSSLNVRGRAIDFINQYRKDCPVQYEEGKGDPVWSESGCYDGQTIRLTFFGPKGKGIYGIWQETDTQIEVFGQGVYRYERGSIHFIEWVPPPDHDYIYKRDAIEIPVRAGKRPTTIPRTVPSSYVLAPGTSVPAATRAFLNCVVSYENTNPKWLDVQAQCRAEEKERKRRGPAHDTIECVLSLMKPKPKTP